ncbi:transcription factor Jun [Patella vulgata]|uniref:transcription factor Jun n=1 Tax=Patella vulgata TaxID=6465 RepID=UPI00217FDEC2|nr:transcription factor Jun [Patella vulgata]
MDTTFYHEENPCIGREGLKRKVPFYKKNGPPAAPASVQKLKESMSLDFNSSSDNTKRTKFTNLLQSPDLNMLKLASPELEKMIIQANGMVTTTPTPTQFIFPKFVTEEQEAYARGFVVALEELHGDEDVNSKSPPLSAPFSTASQHSLSLSSSVPITSQVFTTTTSLPGGLVNLSTSTHNKSHDNRRSSSSPLLLTKFKEEPQTVPCFSGISSNPPMSPIDMENQERIKIDRKRARNRVAARKCRTRKLERINRLEDRVTCLKDQNDELSKTANTLRDQVCKLKRQIIDHVNGGCQIMMTQNISF